MSKVKCKYHADIPARWACRNCQINYCKACIKDDGHGRDPHCPVCRQQLESLGSANLVTPFWQRMGKFFLYPLHLQSTIFLIVLTILTVMLSGGLMGFLLYLVISIVFIKYCYSVLEDTALGHLKPMPISKGLINDEMELPFKQFIMIAAIFAGNAAILKHLGVFMFFISISITYLALPANIMVLAMEHSLFAALNPVIVFSVIRRIGAPYLLLYFLMSMLSIASATMMDILVSIFHIKIAYALTIFTSMYFSVVTFHLMGYTLYQYHDVLGYNVDVEADEFDIKQKSMQESVNPELREIEILIQEGNLEEATNRIEAYIHQHPVDEDAISRHIKLLILTGNTDKLSKQGQKYISTLIAQDKSSQALSLFVQIFAKDNTFRPTGAKERHEISRLLMKGGHGKIAVSLLNNLHNEFPNYDGIPAAYLLVAQVLCEQLNNDKKAKTVLQFLLQNYPDSSNKQEISDYLNVVEGLNNA